MKAERETSDRLIAHFLADKIGASFQGRISGVTKVGLFVKLTETGADGLVPIRTLGSEYFNYDEARHALIGTRTGAMYRLGDVVDVRLVEAAPVAGALRFEMLSAGNEAPRSRRREHGRSKGADDREPHPNTTKFKSSKKSKPGRNARVKNKAKKIIAKAARVSRSKGGKPKRGK